MSLNEVGRGSCVGDEVSALKALPIQYCINDVYNNWIHRLSTSTAIYEVIIVWWNEQQSVYGTREWRSMSAQLSQWTLYTFSCADVSTYFYEIIL